MPKTFDVVAVHGQEFTINPLNVAFIRAIVIRRAEHADTCNGDPANPNCRVARPDLGHLPDMTCGYSADVPATEICFNNTTGQQSAVQVAVEKREIKNLLDEALRYNI